MSSPPWTWTARLRPSNGQRRPPRLFATVEAPAAESGTSKLAARDGDWFQSLAIGSGCGADLDAPGDVKAFDVNGRRTVFELKHA